uniref:ATP-dependent DNA helicase n=1 Tax=Octopus bimaculoides TaxID=37653 RepID=A0A0L8IAA4_OCTBM
MKVFKRSNKMQAEENILLQNNGVRSQIVDATLKRSFLCDHVEVVELTTNLRFLTESRSDEREFANYLLDVGNGNISVEQNPGEFQIKLSNDLCLESGTLSDLCDFIYADLKNNLTNPVWLANRTINTPTNEAAQFVNDFLLTRIPGELKIYRNSDTADATDGHYSDIRYIIISLHDHIIEAEVASGPYAGSTLLIPRIPHMSQEMEFTFTCKKISCQASFCFDMQQDTRTDF